MRCCKLLPLIYGKRYNAVCAIGSEGLLALAFYLRANNLDTMMHFFMFHLFSEVSPVMQAFPGDRSVLILDNASYHHAEQDLVTRFCQSKGVRVHFLPPYSPDFNPIGGTFDATLSRALHTKHIRTLSRALHTGPIRTLSKIDLSRLIRTPSGLKLPKP